MLAYCIIWILWPLSCRLAMQRVTAQHAIRCTLSSIMSCGMLKLKPHWLFWSRSLGWMNILSIWLVFISVKFALNAECSKVLWTHIFLAFVYRICELFFSSSNEVQIRLQWRSWFKMLWDNVIYLEIDVHARYWWSFFYSWWCWSCTRLTGSCARCTVKICNQHRYSTWSVVVVVFVVSLSLVLTRSVCNSFIFIALGFCLMFHAKQVSANSDARSFHFCSFVCGVHFDLWLNINNVRKNVAALYVYLFFSLHFI